MTITINDLDNQDVTLNATIPSGAAISNTIDTKGFSLKSVQFPTALDAAVISLKGSWDNVNFFPLVSPSGINVQVGNASTINSITISLSNYPSINPFNLPRYLQVWSQNAGVDVNQTANRLFTLILSPNAYRKP